MAGRVRVLHADDDPELLDLSRRLLGRDGDDGTLTTSTATTAEEAVDVLRSDDVDCLVSDSMTTPDGEPLVGVARREFPDVGVVMFTGHDEPAGADDADAVVEKGEGFGALRGTVESVAAAAGDRRTGEEWTPIARHDWATGREFVTTLVPAVAAHVGRPVEAMPTLYDSVDGEALGRLLRSASPESRLRVRVRYCGLDLILTGEGVVGVVDGGH
jgi:CheY-like chemotaxis protein